MKTKLYQLFSPLPLLLQYILIPFVLTVIPGAILAGLLYAVLALTGYYGKLENALDLKAGSPWILIPLFAALAGAVLSFLVGFLMYFHKYKRPVPKTNFNKNFAAVMAGKKKKQENTK